MFAYILYIHILLLQKILTDIMVEDNIKKYSYIFKTPLWFTY